MLQVSVDYFYSMMLRSGEVQTYVPSPTIPPEATCGEFDSVLNEMHAPRVGNLMVRNLTFNLVYPN